MKPSETLPCGCRLEWGRVASPCTEIGGAWRAGTEAAKVGFGNPDSIRTVKSCDKIIKSHLASQRAKARRKPNSTKESAT